MAIAFRPRRSPSSIGSRYAAQALADGGEEASRTLDSCEKGAIKSVVTPMAGFAGVRRPHPGRHTTTPAAFRYPLAVSLRTPVASSMRRKDHPSFPRAITCCFFSSLKTLLMPREPIKAPLGVNVPDFPMAGFQVTLYGRFWVTAEAVNSLGRNDFLSLRCFGLRPQARRELSSIGEPLCAER